MQKYLSRKALILKRKFLFGIEKGISFVLPAVGEENRFVKKCGYRASKSLAIQIKDKKVRSSNLDLPLGRDNVNEYSAQHDPDGNGEVMVRAIALRYIIIAPVVCRKGYQKDSLGKCRRLL